MAGKHEFVDNGFSREDSLLVPPVYPGTRPDRAFAEGRKAQVDGLTAGDNPHPFATPEGNNWGAGFISMNTPTLGMQMQTAVED